MPFQLPDTWLQLSVGEEHACGVTTDHGLQCWGANAFGQLGVGSFVEFHEPQPVGSGSNWAYVAAGIDNTCAVTTTAGAATSKARSATEAGGERP
jgi:alpha-tubulin suppressor-like RCC1 family protein